MNKLAIATCVLGLIALVSAGDQDLDVCLQLLAEKAGEIILPVDVSNYVAEIESKFPLEDGHLWSELNENEREALRSQLNIEYPMDGCDTFTGAIIDAQKAVIEGQKDCTAELFDLLVKGTVDAVKLAGKNEILSTRIKANDACYAFLDFTSVKPPTSNALSD